MRFQLLAGKHQSGNKKNRNIVNYSARDRLTGLHRTDEFGEQLSDVVESDLDLAKLFGKNKFKLLAD